jgi:adenylosuccinate synthase
MKHSKHPFTEKQILNFLNETRRKSPDILVGLQWGDEGKGKITNALADQYQWIVRYQGGDNAGHTVYIDGKKFVTHSIPTGILNSNCKVVITHGCVVNIPEIIKEVKLLEKTGISFKDRFYLSENAHLITPEHLRQDKSNQVKFGSTGKGIGPAYRDKIYRAGLRVKDYSQLIDEDKIIVTDTRKLLRDAIYKGDKVLFEGAQAVMLDIEMGTYPHVTSSPCIASYAPAGSGLPLTFFKHSIILGVAKAYTTRIGTGPFPSEIHDKKVAQNIQFTGKEYGATTGRLRRVGWLDIPQLKYACEVNGISGIALTKLDIFSEADYEIKVATEYKINGKWTTDYCDEPESIRYESFSTWPKITETNWDGLPDNLKKYVDFIEDSIGVDISMIGVGQDRNQLIYR